MEPLTLGQAVLEIKGDTSQAVQAVRDLNQTAVRQLEATERQIKETTLGFDRMGRSVEASTTRASAAGQRLSGVFMGLGRLLPTIAWGAAATGSLKLAASAEQTAIAFETLLGSGKEARDFLADLDRMAANTPFNVVGLQRASQQLLAFGFDVEKVLPMLGTIGDAVSAMGGGTAELDRVVRALGQVQTKGRLTGEELLQLSEIGINGFAILQEQLGLTGDQVANIADQGIDAQVAIDALLTGMESRFKGSMKAQSESTAALWGATVEQMQFVLRDLGAALIETFNIKGFLKTVIADLRELREEMAYVSSSPAERLQSALEDVDKSSRAAADGIKQLRDATSKAELLGAVETLADTMDGDARTAFENYAKSAVQSAATTGQAVVGILRWVALAQVEMKKDALKAAEQMQARTQEELDLAQTRMLSTGGDENSAVGRQLATDQGHLADEMARLREETEALEAARARGDDQAAERLEAAVAKTKDNVAYLKGAIDEYLTELPSTQLTAATDADNEAIRRVRDLLAEVKELERLGATGTLPELSEWIAELEASLQGGGGGGGGGGAADDVQAAADSYTALAERVKALNEQFDNAPAAEQGRIGAEIKLLEGRLEAMDRNREADKEQADALKRNTAESVAWIQRLSRETTTGMKGGAETVGLLTAALERQRAEQRRLAGAGLIDGAQFDLAEERIKLLEAALTELVGAPVEIGIDVRVNTGQDPLSGVRQAIQDAQAAEAMAAGETDEWARAYERANATATDFSDTLGRLHQMGQNAPAPERTEEEIEATERLIEAQRSLYDLRFASQTQGDEARWAEGVAMVVNQYERANGVLTSYSEAMYALSAAGLWNAETQAMMAERFGTTATSAALANEQLAGITTRLLEMGASPDPAGLTALREELDGLAASDFIPEDVLQPLYDVIDNLNNLDVSGIEAFKETIGELFSSRDIDADALTALQEALAAFEDDPAESLEETVALVEAIGEQAGLTEEQVQTLVTALREAALAELDFDTGVAEANATRLLDAVANLVESTELFGAVGQQAAALMVDGYAAIQAAQEATRVHQEAAAVAQLNGTAANKEAMMDAGKASQVAWAAALTIIGQGVSAIGNEIGGLGGDVADFAGKALQHAGNIAMAFATDPTGISGAIAIATAAIDFLVSAFNHAAEAAKRTADQTKALAEAARDVKEAMRGASGTELEAQRIRLDTQLQKGEIDGMQHATQMRRVNINQIGIDRQNAEAAAYQDYLGKHGQLAGMDWEGREGDRDKALDDLANAYAANVDAIRKQTNARLGANQAQFEQDYWNASSEAEEAHQDDFSPNSIGGMREQIEGLRRRQERATSPEEIRRLGNEIADLEGRIQSLVSDAAANAARGSIDWHEAQISQLREAQGKTANQGRVRELGRQIADHEAAIQQMLGTGAEASVKGSVDYYEARIKDLQEEQGKATSRGKWEGLQRQIEGYEAQIERITGTKEEQEAAEAENLRKGSIEYYEAQISALKERQQGTTNRADYEALARQIGQYENKIKAITGGDDNAEQYAEGTIDYYEAQVRVLREAQGAAKTPEAYAKLQGQIEGYEAKIARIKGEVEQGTVRNSIAYYEDIISDLGKRQEQTTNPEDFQKLQTQINEYQAKIDAIKAGSSDNLQNSIGYYEDIIGDLKRQQENARTPEEFAGFQAQIDAYQGEIDRIAGEIEKGYAEGSIGFYEDIISDLRDRQKHATTPEEFASLQSELEGYQNEIDRLEGVTRAETIRGSVAYYENEINKLKEQQQAATNRAQHRGLQEKIDAFQTQILAITEDAGADAIEGTLGFYEARIAAVRERMDFAADPETYRALENEIAGYEEKIAEIKGLGDLQGSIDYYTALLEGARMEFNAAATDAERAALQGEIDQLEATLAELTSAAEAAQGSLDSIRERYRVAAEDFAGTFKQAMNDASNFEDFFSNLQGSLRDTVRNAIIEGANSANDFQGLSDSVARALADGTVTQAELDNLQEQATQIAESRRGVYDLLDDLTLFGESLSEAGEGVKGMNAELTNVPAGLKLAEARFRAAAAEVGAAQERATEAIIKTADDVPPPPSSLMSQDLSLTPEEMAALAAEHRRSLEAQALYLRERGGAYAEKRKGVIPEEVLTAELDALYESVGETLRNRGPRWAELYERWEGGRPSEVDTMPVLADPTLPGGGEMNIMPYPDLPELTTPAIEQAGGVTYEGVNPTGAAAASDPLDARLEAVINRLAERGFGVRVDEAHFHGVQNVEQLYEELKRLGAEAGRAQHGSSVAR